MKAQTTRSFQKFFLFVLFSLFLFIGTAWSAGAPSKPAGDSDTDKTARKMANDYFEKGMEYRKAENWAASAAQFEKAVEADSKYAEAYSNLGYAYRKQGMFDKAVRNYQTAIRLDDQLAAAYEYLGEAYVEMGKMDMARRQLEILNQLGAEEEAEDLEGFIAGKKEK